MANIYYFRLKLIAGSWVDPRLMTPIHFSDPLIHLHLWFSPNVGGNYLLIYDGTKFPKFHVKINYMFCVEC